MKRTLLFAITLMSTSFGFAQSYVPTGNSSYTTLTYDGNRYILQQNDGQFDPSLFITNIGGTGSLSNKDANGNFLNYHVISSNIDGQVNYETYTCGTSVAGTNNCNTTTTTTPVYKISSRLVLDQDGHFSLGGGAGGGIASDPTTGNTCIPYNASSGAYGACNVPGAMTISQSGQLVKFWGQTTAGTGMGIKVWEGSGTITGTWGPNTIFTTPTGTTGYGAVGQEYQIMGYASVANNNAGATCYAQINYTDDTGATSQQSSTFNCASTGQHYSYNFVFKATPNTAVQLQIFSSNSSVQTNSIAKLVLW